MNQRLAATCSKFASYTPMFTAQAAQYRAALDAAGGDWDRVASKVQASFGQTDAALGKFEHNFYHHTKVRRSVRQLVVGLAADFRDWPMHRFITTCASTSPRPRTSPVSGRVFLGE